MLSKCGAGEDSWESLGQQGDKSILKEINPKYSLEGLMLKLKLKLQYFGAPILWPPIAKNHFIRKDPDAGKDWGQEEKGVTEDERVGWYDWLNGHEFQQIPGDSKRTEKSGVLQSMRLQRGHKLATEQQQVEKSKSHEVTIVWIFLYEMYRKGKSKGSYISVKLPKKKKKTCS